MQPLLTPEEVANLLQISIKTVYENALRLGGFYPAGIRKLRFRYEFIQKIMEGPDRVLSQGRSRHDGKRGTEKASQEPCGGSEDPNRHGLLGPKQSVSRLVKKVPPYKKPQK